jgi:hypothetical protein
MYFLTRRDACIAFYHRSEHQAENRSESVRNRFVAILRRLRMFHSEEAANRPDYFNEPPVRPDDYQILLYCILLLVRVCAMPGRCGAVHLIQSMMYSSVGTHAATTGT